MKKKFSAAKESSFVPADFRPDRVRTLMRAIKGEMEGFEGRAIQYDELAHYGGQSISSVFDKLQRTAQPQIEALLGWLERLPEAIRNRLITEACRSFPTLRSHRLSFDPTQVSHLNRLIREWAVRT